MTPSSPHRPDQADQGGSGQEEASYREMFADSVAGMYRTSLEGRVLDANQALVEMLGFESVEDLMSRDIGTELYADPSQREHLLEALERDGLVKSHELILRRRDGSTFAALGNTRAIRDADGRFTAMEGTLIDISAHKEAEEALVASERRYRRLVEQFTDGVFETTPDGRILRANQALVDMLGYESEQDLLDTPVWELYADPDQRARLSAQALESGRMRERELILKRTDGRVVHCLVNATVIDGPDGTVRFEGTLTDVSERARDTEERRQTAQRQERQNDAFIEITRSARTSSLDEAWQQATRVAARTLEVERVGVWLFDGEGLRIVNTCLWEASKGHYSSGLELAAETAPEYFRALREERAIDADDAATDPRTREFRDNYLEPLGITSMLDVPIHTGGRLLGILCCEHVGPRRRWMRDEIDFAGSLGNWLAQEAERHERRQAQEELRASEAAFRALFETTVGGLFRTDHEGVFTAANGSFVRMLGYDSSDQILGRSLTHDIFADPERPLRLLEALRRERLMTNVEVELRRSDGRTIRVLGNFRCAMDDEGEVLYYEGSLADISERVELEEQLRRSQRMEALGNLAGGVAHDFNNLLTIMMGYLELAMGKLLPDNAALADLEQVEGAASRAAALTRHLLAYTRQQVLHPEVVDPNRIVREIDRLLERVIGEDIEFRLDLAEATHPVRVDPGQIEQVLINLAVNARDAMPQGGLLTLRTRAESIERPRALENFVIEPADYTVLSVVDDGEGMDEATRRRVLEPFFTTKPVGQGTGLGLSTAYGIVKQSGGYISIASEPGGGTEVDIYLPSSESSRHAGEEEPEDVESASGSATVLLVEDDVELRQLVARVLEGQGYEVLAPRSPEDALSLHADGERHIDLLLTDIVMPGMSGRELAHEMRQARPDLPVLYVSGYSGRVLPEVLGGTEEFLRKPFGPEELAAKVRRILERDRLER